jgi:hypothetical protein
MNGLHQGQEAGADDFDSSNKDDVNAQNNEQRAIATSISLSKGALKTRRWRDRKKQAADKLKNELQEMKDLCKSLMNENQELRERLRLLGAPDPEVGLGDVKTNIKMDFTGATITSETALTSVSAVDMICPNTNKRPSNSNIKTSKKVTRSEKEEIENAIAFASMAKTRGYESQSSGLKFIVNQEEQTTSADADMDVPDAPPQAQDHDHDVSSSSSGTPTPHILSNDASMIQLGLLANPNMHSHGATATATGVAAVSDSHAPHHHASRKKPKTSPTDAEDTLSLEEDFGPPLGAWGSAPCADDEDQEKTDKKMPGTMESDRSTAATAAAKREPTEDASMLDPMGRGLGYGKAKTRDIMSERAAQTLRFVELLRQQQQQQQQSQGQVQGHQQREHQYEQQQDQTQGNAKAAAASILAAYRQQQLQQQQQFQQRNLVAQLLRGGTRIINHPSDLAPAPARAAIAGDPHPHHAAVAAVVRARGRKNDLDQAMLDFLTNLSRR